MAFINKGEQKLDALIKSAYASPNSISYHGSDIKIEINLNRAIKQDFFFNILINGDWVEVDKDTMAAILNQL